MIHQRFKTGRLIGLFLLGVVLFNYPILTLFNRRIMLAGIPLLYLYIFAAWSLLIVGIVIITKTRAKTYFLKAPGSTEPFDSSD